ncbi:hypothetical protein QFZ35_003015 [Arthrobacter ulcerisalmonis]|nr:hypothetical protein [Arthrobacter ulcerisalmonis]
MTRATSVRVPVLEQLHPSVTSAFHDKRVHLFPASGMER